LTTKNSGGAIRKMDSERVVKIKKYKDKRIIKKTAILQFFCLSISIKVNDIIC
jgi:hypothetical protein